MTLNFLIAGMRLLNFLLNVFLPVSILLGPVHHYLYTQRNPSLQRYFSQSCEFPLCSFAQRIDTDGQPTQPDLGFDLHYAVTHDPEPRKREETARNREYLGTGH